MFDSLRKKLKEAVDRVSKSIKEEKQPGYEEALEELPPEEEKTVEEIEKKIGEKLLEEKIEEAIEEKAEIPGLPEDEEKEKPIDEFLRLQKKKVAKEKEAKEEERIKPLIKTEEEIELPEPEKKPGFFKRLFEKTITEDDVKAILKELELVLIESDVALDVAEKIGEDITRELLDKSVRRGKIADAIKDALRKAMLDVMSQEKINLEERIKNKDGIFTVLFLGFNGTGKTTTLAKFATKFRKFQPVVAAGDTFRAASIEQLEEHAKKAGFRLIKHQYGADSAAVIFDAKKAALAAGSKLVLADTAGRSHSNVNLMDELKKVVRVNMPDMKILVLDSVTGNDIYEQSRLFDAAVGVDAIILTKADVYDKGGAALSATYTIKKPILFLGTGQNYDDLKEFRPEEIVDNLLK